MTGLVYRACIIFLSFYTNLIDVMGDLIRMMLVCKITVWHIKWHASECRTRTEE